MRRSYRKPMFLPSYSPGRDLIEQNTFGEHGARDYARIILDFWNPARSLKILELAAAQFDDTFEFLDAVRNAKAQAIASK